VLDIQSRLCHHSYMRVKLKKWQRIGIIASAVWTLGAGICEFNYQRTEDTSLALAVYGTCTFPGSPRTEQSCSDEYTSYLDTVRQYEWEDATIVSFTPILPAWGLIYLLRFLIQWVKNGQ
jgi:hypothetical protein